MRIVHTEASWGWGGQEIRILRESIALRSRGHEVIIACDIRSSIYKSALSDGLKFPVRLGQKRPADFSSLRGALLSLKPDLVVCHSSTDHWLCALTRLSAAAKFPIIRARHISTPIQRNPFTDWLYRGGCDAITTTSESIREAMIQQTLVPGGKVVSIPTGIDANEFGLLSKGQAREFLNLPEKGLILGIVATLRSWKGHSDLLLAFSKIKLDATLIVIGDGPQRSALEQSARDLAITEKILFVGQQSSVSTWLAALDLFVLPSFANEGVPQAILQAMATGLPIVTCPVGGIPEALEHYSASFFTPAREPLRLQQVLEQRLSSLDELPTRIALRQVPFSISKMTDACEALYEHVVHRDVRPR